MVRQEIDKPKILEGETIETRWDPKKIIIGLIVLSVLGMLGAIMLTGAGKQIESINNKTLGVSTDEVSNKEAPPLPTKDDVERIIGEAREAISNITADNLISSQAAIQKIIQDLGKLKEGKDTGSVFCDLVCKK